jgi:nucleotide-binding universal stress UspA family protein
MRELLVLTDFSDRAKHAVDFAEAIALKTHSEILLFNAFYVPEIVTPESTVYPSVIERDHMQQLELLAKEIRGRNKEEELSVKYMDAPGDIASNIGHILLTHPIWLIIMGEKLKEGLISRLFLGSNAREVIDVATCPVLLVPEKSIVNTIKRIVFALDLDKPDASVLKYITAFASCFDSDLILLHVEPGDTLTPVEASEIEDFKNLVNGTKYAGITYMKVKGEDIPHSIDDYLKHSEIDLLVMLHRDRSADKIYTSTNSITKQMMEYNEIPLLVLPPVVNC